MDEELARRAAQQARELASEKWWRLERRLADKREAWFSTPAGRPHAGRAATPRQAFETLFFACMGLDPAHLQVVREDPDEIVWRSINPCPTLEACALAGLDTRRVCRAVCERPVQRFLSRMDPELRFLRSYDEIRPHAPHCLERIVRVPAAPMMRLALEEARRSLAAGEKGYGAVAALGRRVLAAAHDTAGAEADPSRHAEVNALARAVRELGDPDLRGAVLYSTCEPCPMCASLAVWSNVTAMVYGASIAQTAALGRSRIHVDARAIADAAPACIEVHGGVLADECLDLYR
ncbi:MAG: nucleoside deaminase [Thermodesulfobacteriota bacterium]